MMKLLLILPILLLLACKESPKPAAAAAAGTPASDILQNPTSAIATVNSAVQITLSWSSGGGTTSGYRIAYQTGSTAPASCALGTTISESLITGTSKAINALAVGTQYSFRVCAINASSPVEVSSGVTVTSTTLSAPVAPPPDPTGLSATVNSSVKITLSWTSGGGTTTGYRIAYQTGATAPATCALGTTISESSISGTAKAISGLVAGTQYSFRVCAINANLIVDVSSGVTVTGTTLFAAPPNPTGLSATVDSTTQITLSWTSGGGTTAGYRIAYQTGATAPEICSLGTIISEGSIVGTSKAISGLAVGTQYSFRVCAINANSTADVSTGVTVTARTLYAAAPNPTGLIATVDSNMQITLSWISGGGTTTDYRIAYQAGATAPATCALGTTIGESSISGTSKAISGLTGGAEYSFRVCAINANLTPDVSSGISATATTTGPFISVWSTTTSNESITLPLRAGYTYNFTVDWGDGTSDSTISAFNDPDITHTYVSAGLHTLTISGVVQAWYFNDTGSNLKIITVVDLGSVGWTSLNSAFKGCANLTAFSGGETASVTDMSQMFYGAATLTSLDFSSFSTTNVTNMSEMFAGTSALTSLDLSSFNTGSVTDMSGMFAGASALASLDLSNFDTTSVTDMGQMFLNASALTNLDLSSFNTVGVSNMSWMFAGASALTSLDLSSFNTANVTNMSEMFSNTSDLTSLNLASFNTTSVTDMSSMFLGASALTTLDLSTFDTANVTTMDSLFAYTTELLTLNTTDWNIALASGSVDVFSNANASLAVTCNQGGPPGSGNFFGKACQ